MVTIVAVLLTFVFAFFLGFAISETINNNRHNF